MIGDKMSSLDVETTKTGAARNEVLGHSQVPMKIKQLANFRGDLPRYESAGASGMDVRAQLGESIVLQPGERAMVPTGLSVAVPFGFELQARPRSGWAVKEGVSLVNTPGTIDADYRGEIKILLINLGQNPVTVKDQERIAQLVLCPVVQASLIVSEELDATARGAGGFGSTGR